MIIIAEVSELTRKIKLPTDRVLSVNGDYQVDGIAFKLPATYEGDFDFSTAAARVHWTGVDKVEHTNLITEEDGNGYPLWVMPSELTQGGHGVIEFAISFVATDETAAVTKRWISDPVSFRNRRTVNGSNEDEEAEEETIYDRLASAIAALRAAQASVDEVNEVLARITNSSPVVVETVADLSGLDTTEHQLAIVRADGYLYCYNGAAWKQGIKYGSYELDTTLKESGKAADAAAVGAAVTEIKEDLSTLTVNEKVELTTGGYIALNVNVADVENPTLSNDYSYAVVPCSEGDKCTINASGRSIAKPWGFVSNDGTVLATAKADSLTVDTVVSNTVIVAPANTAYLVINNRGTGVSYKELTITDKVAKLSEDLSASVADLKSDFDSFEGTIDKVKNALLNCFKRVAWIDKNGLDYYDELYASLCGNDHWTWAYKANELLDDFEYVTSVDAEKGSVSKALEEDGMRFYAEASSTGNSVVYYFDPSESNNAVMEVELKIFSMTTTETAGGFMAMIGNGTYSAVLYVRKNPKNNKLYTGTFEYYDNSMHYTDLTEIEIDTLYILQVELSDNTSILKVDGEEIFRSTRLNKSPYYFNNLIRIYTPNVLSAGATSLAIRSIKFKDLSSGE